VSHRARVVNGVKHARGCACPTCDPDNLLLARRRAENKTARALPPAISPHVAAARYIARAHARRPSDPPSPDSKRFMELLREGRRAAEALQIIAAEKEKPS
jgi:hypothetical protein